MCCFAPGIAPLRMPEKFWVLASIKSHSWEWRVTWTHIRAKAPRWCDHHLAEPADKVDARISPLMFLGSLQFSLGLVHLHDGAISFSDRKRVGQNQILWQFFQVDIFHLKSPMYLYQISMICVFIETVLTAQHGLRKTQVPIKHTHINTHIYKIKDLKTTIYIYLHTHMYTYMFYAFGL